MLNTGVLHPLNLHEINASHLLGVMSDGVADGSYLVPDDIERARLGQTCTTSDS